MEIILQNGNTGLRKLCENDIGVMAVLANNERISRNLRDAFPFPYTIQDATNFVKLADSRDSGIIFAIDFDGLYVGNIRIVPGQDVYRQSAEIGYFLGEPYWNRGIATKAVDLLTDYCFCQLGFVRVWAGVFEYNVASQRVLEKCGFKREAILKLAVSKQGKLWNEIRYAKLNPALNPEQIGRL